MDLEVHELIGAQLALHDVVTNVAEIREQPRKNEIAHRNPPRCITAKTADNNCDIGAADRAQKRGR